ncbi:MAG: T9SS type B sorting domain-containing protein [Bacteroidota bacterium]
MRIKHYLMLLVFLFSVYSVNAQTGTPFKSRLGANATKIRGNIKLVGNTVLGHTNTMPTFDASGNVTNLATLTNQANQATSNGANGQNDNENMEYIDIDGDASTFSSSSAFLDIDPRVVTCKRIVFAGLYWAATYPYERSTDQNAEWNSFPANTPRVGGFNQIKFKLPVGGYTNITADEIIFDGYNSTTLSSSFKGAPYVCFKDVTTMLQGLADANGNYTVGNVKAARGKRLDGASAGWNLVVIYESPNSNVRPRHFVVYDGLERITGTHDVTINISGFRSTLTGKFDTNIGVAALDGDREKGNDRYQFSSFAVGPFIDMKDSFNAFDNFFDSSLTDNNAIVNNINPVKNNTYGFDLDQVELPNPGQSNLVNGASNAYIRLTTQGNTEDAFMPYVATFSVDDYVPNVALTKTVNNLLGANIDGQQIPTCTDFKYIIGFQNLGSDNAIGVAPADPNFVVITDVLPANVTYVSTNTSLIPGSTATYNAGTRTLSISIPRTYFEVNDPRYTFEIYVKTACNCADISDACSTTVRNQAFVTYQGQNGGQIITTDPSSSVFDTTCLVGNASPTNSTILPTCRLESDVYICGTTTSLSGPAGYDNYIWTGPTGAVFVPNNTSQNVTVNMLGDYTVNATKAGCAPFTYVFHVRQFSSSITNPVLPYNEASPIRTCVNNNEVMPYIYLCGAADHQLINTGITDAQSITWQIYNPACGAYSPLDCPNTTASCWSNVASGSSYDVSLEGNYRIVLTYSTGCSKIFYFNVLKNLLDFQIVTQDIYCTTPGSVTITGVPTSGYSFSLLNSSGVVIQGPQPSSNNVFVVGTAGIYGVSIQQTSITNGCVFYNQTPVVINEHIPSTSVTNVTQPICYGDPASITLAISDGRPNYFFNLFNSTGGLVASSGAQTSNTYTFSGLAQGQTYTWNTTTTDGCPATGTVTIDNPLEIKVNLSLIKNITCTQGTVQVDVTGGEAPYFIYVSPNTGPPQPYLAGNTFPVSTPGGTYTVNVLDSKNCRGTAQITVTPIPASTINPIETDIRCFADGNVGQIDFRPTLNGNTMMFAISTVSATGPFTYVTQSVFNNLAPGTYYCSAQYTYNGDTCTIPTVTLVIDRNPEIIAALDITTALTCTAGTNNPGTAVITATASGGVTPIQASINGGTTFFPVPHNFTVNGSGTYTVIFMDNVGCRVSRTVTVLPLTPPTSMSFVVSPLQCNVTSTTGNVTVTVSVTGGTAPLSYQIVSPLPASAVQSGNQFTGLNPGTTYTFQVVDANGCTIRQDLVIPALPTVTVSATIPRPCFGSTTAITTVTVTGTTNFQYSINGGPNQPYPGSNIFNVTVPTGSAVIITVIDTATNCSGTTTITIPVGSDITGTLQVTPIRCVPASGSVEVLNVSGGWGGPYRYELLQPNGTVLGPQSSNIFTPLTQTGSYTVTIIDSNGCRKALPSFTLSAPVTPVLSIASSDLCVDAGGTQVTVQVNSGTGTGPFQFSLNGGAYVPANLPLLPGHQYINLSTGGTGHVITVRDAYGCIGTITLPVINPTLRANATITKRLDCTGSPNATIRVDITGGYPAYSYQVSTNGGTTYGSSVAVVGATFNYSAATAGTYTFLITDARGCTFTVTAPTISALIPISATFTQTNNLCDGDTNGSFTVVPSGGLPPYLISVTGGTFTGVYTSQTTYSGLGEGTYTVNVRDANLCNLVPPLTINITAPDPIVFTQRTNPITCGPSGTLLGSIEILTLGGGTAPYRLRLIDLSGGTPNVVVNNATAPHTFGNLNFGNYQVVISDANGCSTSFTTTVANTVSDLTIDVTTIAGNCTTGACIRLTATGGVGPYYFAQYPLPSGTYDYATNAAFYQLETSPGEYTFCGLASGVVYSFIVYDSVGGCYFFRQATTPTQVFGTIRVAETHNNVTCNGAADGNVTFTISNYAGTSVSYQIFNGTTNQPVAPTLAPVVLAGLTGLPVTITNLGPLPVGTYYVLVRELTPGPSFGCTFATPVFTITESATPLSVTAQILKNANCNSNGTIQANASGGTAPYLYYFVLSPGAAPAVGDPLWSSSNIANLPASATPYRVYVLDAFGCIQFDEEILPADPVPSISAVVNASSVCNAEGLFEIDVTINSAGIEPYTFSLDGGAYQNLIATYPLTYPYTFTISNLSSGTHTISVLDKNGCGVTNVAPLSVTITPPLNINAGFTLLPVCDAANGTITANASGGSGVPANYLYTLYDSTGVGVLFGPQASNAFTAVAPGTYWVEVRDITTNCTARVRVSLADPIAVNYDLVASHVSCFGGSDGTITVTNVVGDGPFEYQIVSPIVMPASPQTSPLFTGLGAGTYEVEVTSARGCKLLVNKTITINQPAQLVLNATGVTSPTCSNNAIQPVTVTVNVDPSTGTAPYLYSFNGGAFTSNNVFTVFATTSSQTINFTVRDAKGCTISSSANVAAYTPLSATATTAPVTCSAPPVTGNYTITASGGTAPYTYTLVAGNATAVTQHAFPNDNIFDITQPGSYYFRVTDNTGCWVDLARHDVPAFDLITISAPVTTNVTCSGSATGTIGSVAFPIQINNYTGNYTWVLQGSALSGSGNTGTPLIISNVPAGNYTLLITETQAPFCDASIPVDITAPATPLIASAQIDALVNCNNTGGVITASASGGWGGPYQFELVRLPSTIVAAYSTNSSFSNLPAGNYVVNVRDNGGCIVTTNPVLTLTTPVQIAATVTPSTLLCTNDTNGSITVTGVSGGVGPYSYILLTYDTAGTTVVATSAPQTTNIFQNLPAGIYEVVVTDGYAGCDSPRYRVTIANPTEVKATLTKVAGTLDCLTNTETLSLLASGGTGPYSYATTAGGPFTLMTTNPMLIPNNGPNTYTYYVRDNNNCVSLPATVTVQDLEDLRINVKPESNLAITCFGDFSGSLYLSASGGVGGTYTYIVTGPNGYNSTNTTGIFTNLEAGTYNITVNNGTCTIGLSQAIANANPALAAVANVTNVTCRGDKTGEILLDIANNGVQLVIQYQLDKTPGSESVGTGTITNPFGGTFIISELFAGTYTLTLSDGNGCQTQIPITISEPASAVSATVTSTNETCVELDNGSIIFTNITGGNGGPYTIGYSLPSTNANPSPTPIQQATVAGPGPETIGGIDANINGGIFEAFVLDRLGCKFTFPVRILPGDDYDPVAVVTYPCVNNTPAVRIEVLNMKAASPYRFATAYQFSLDGLANVATNASLDHIFTSADYPTLLTAGPHTIYVYGPNGCDKIAIPDPLNVTPLIQLSVTLTNPVINTALATVNGGSGNFTYTFYGDGQVVQSGSSDTFIYRRQYGQIRVVVTDDSGCTAEAIASFPYIPICVPDVLTPDGNGQNDDWGPGCIDPTVYPKLVTKIYDRYGRLIATLPVSARWDGTYEGKKLPSGDYWYVIKVDSSDGQEIVGHFTLYR